MSVIQELEAASNRLTHMIAANDGFGVLCYVSEVSLEGCLSYTNDVGYYSRHIVSVGVGCFLDSQGVSWKYAIPVHMVNKIVLRTLDFAMRATWGGDHRTLHHWQRDAIDIIDLIEGMD